MTKYIKKETIETVYETDDLDAEIVEIDKKLVDLEAEPDVYEEPNVNKDIETRELNARKVEVNNILKEAKKSKPIK